MMLPDNAPDWHSLWADLLQGIGAGLLEHDGSRAAQAALAGLAAFDASRERRRAEEERRRGHPSDILSSADLPQEPVEDFDLVSQLSPRELAHFLPLSLEQQQAFEEELGEVARREEALANQWRPKDRSDRRDPGSQPLLPGDFRLPARRKPISVSPFDGWSLGSVLPFGPDGQLNLPTFRR